jgi:hypothetical protein
MTRTYSWSELDVNTPFTSSSKMISLTTLRSPASGTSAAIPRAANALG